MQRLPKFFKRMAITTNREQFPYSGNRPQFATDRRYDGDRRPFKGRALRNAQGGFQINKRTTAQSLDEIDLKIITLLQDDARTSTARLAKEIGVARTTVISRIARLERDGVIAGYSLRLGREVIDGFVQAFVSITVEARSGPDVIRKLSKIVELQMLCSVSGEFDYMLLLQAPSTSRLDKLLDMIGSIDGVARTRTSIVLSKKIERGTQLF